MMQLPQFSAMPPLSFRYGGIPSQDLMPSWQSQTPVVQATDAGGTRLACLDSSTGLKVTATVRRFAAFPAVEWVLELENLGTASTPLIENILPIDVSIPLPGRERVRLHYANGSLCQMDDWLPRLTELRPGARTALSPIGGRSSNGVCPFVNLQGEGSGLVLAIGWSGQWAATFERGEQGLHVSAGMEHTHLRLHPCEKIRTPRILLLSWQGDDMETGNNLLRQLLLAHYLPRLDGQLVLPPVAQMLQMYFYLTGNAGEQYELKAIPRRTP